MKIENAIKSITTQSMRNLIRPEVYLAQRSIQKIRQLSGQKGRLPGFLILGAQKAGTTTLYDLIMQHPNASPARTKEIAFFDRHYGWGVDWYMSNFPKTGEVTGEATPCYLYLPYVAERIARTLPKDTRFIVLLRNPVDRAISHYFHERRLGYENLSLEDALDAEEQRIGADREILLGRRHENRSQGQSFSYVDRGRYTEQLTRYFKLFPRRNFYIETSDRFFSEPNEVTKECYDFLGLSRQDLPPVKPKNVGVYAGKIDPGVYNRLRKIFSGEITSIEALIGRELPW